MGNLNSKSKKSTKLNIRQRRIFSEEFKREKVLELCAGLYTVYSFSKLWGVTNMTVYRWLYKYSSEHTKGTTMVVQKDSEAQKTSELLSQVADLERRLGQKQMQIDYLEKLIEIASKDSGIDLKKNIKITL
jgi:transposase